MIIIKKTLEREGKNSPIENAGILQGNYSNLKFIFKLVDNGEPVTIADAKVIITSPKKVNYDIPQSNISFSGDTVTITGAEAMTNYDGTHQLVVQVGNLYTFTTSYNVVMNPAYSPAPITPQDHATYAKMDLSNVDNNVFKQKAQDSGVPTTNDINSAIKYFTNPAIANASRMRYDTTAKVWLFERKDTNGDWVEKFKIGESAIVDVLKLVKGEKPANIPADEIALYNKQLTIDGNTAIRPLFVLPDGNEYSFVVHDEQNDKVVFRKNDGTLVEIPIDDIQDTPVEIRDKLQTLTGDNRLSATAIKDMPVGSIQVAALQGETPYVANKILFPFANGIVNDSGTVTINTSFIITDENDEIVPDCYILEVPTTSILSATASSNSNAVVLDIKGLPVDNGDPTKLAQAKYLSFNGAEILVQDDKVILDIQPQITIDGVKQLQGLKLLEIPTNGLLKAEAEADPDLDGKLYLSFAGLPTRKTASSTAHNAMELRFPQANVLSTTSGIVTIGTGHSVSKDDDELSAAVNTWNFPASGGLNVETDPNNPNGVIVTANDSQPGISITNDDTQPINQTTVAYFPQARIDDGSTTGSKVIKTSTPISCGTDNFDDYKNINFENNDFIVARDNDKLNINFNGISVETDNTETTGIKLFDFDKNSLNLDVATQGIAKVSVKNSQNNGFLATYSHKQVIAEAGVQEVYRTTALMPNTLVWQDDSVVYDKNSGLITLKYTGQNSEKQLFKIAARATVRRQIRQADLGVYLYLFNPTTNDYVQDINNETPIFNTTINKDLISDDIELVTMVSITEDTSFKVILKDDTPNKYIEILDLAMGTSSIMIERVNANNQPSNALANYERLTQQSMRFVKHEYTQSFENAQSLIATTPSANQTVPDDTNLQKDGWLIYFQDEGTYKQNTTPDGSGVCFEMVDKLAGFGYFNIARVLDYEDTWSLRGHEVICKVDRVEQQGEFVIVPIVWRKRMNEYPSKIITGMNNQGLYSTTDGWEVIDASKTVIAEPTPNETTASFTCAYTVPDDAINVGFMLMPSKQQAHSLIKFTDLSIGCNPTFERWVIEYPEQGIEAQLKKDSKYVKFVQYNTTPYDMSQWYQIPNGTQGDNNFYPLYTGEAQSGGNADITRIYDSSSSDFETLHNKGKWRFNKDGKVTVHYKVPISTDKFSDGSDHNTFRIGFVKDTGAGNILNGTPVQTSLRDINIPKSGNIFNDSVRTNGYANVTFAMDVKENDEYWLAVNPINVPRDTANEGHIYSYPSGFVEFTFLENEYAINQLQNKVSELENLLSATADALSNKAYIEVGYDTAQSKPTLEAKVRP